MNKNIYTHILVSVLCYRKRETRSYEKKMFFLRLTIGSLKPGFHIIAPVATIVAVVQKRVSIQKYFLSDASDTLFPYDRLCRSISLTQ